MTYNYNIARNEIKLNNFIFELTDHSEERVEERGHLEGSVLSYETVEKILKRGTPHFSLTNPNARVLVCKLSKPYYFERQWCELAYVVVAPKVGRRWSVVTTCYTTYAAAARRSGIGGFCCRNMAWQVSV